ncbi:retrovirus-related pol polyprotein from transposon TNT 1-94 [Tanacetum coccineum]|uniref:Retrovirus-related pol polyprotein from transposon TNT 1-94 n=1 Tax=Tanacetum coccineum TaxID=301880 RepID=A0ABQ4WWC8_9ASTR
MKDLFRWELLDTLAERTEGVQQLGPERVRVYSDLSLEDKERYNADIRATNILLQGLPKDIYTLINTDAKDIWDNVKTLLEGSELTKEDRESQLYDDFEHFRQNKGETIHDYYVRFAKLINDMRNIKMTMSKMQLNSKFVNNMFPEWGRFVTTVKLNRGLRDSNYDQLYAYLKQQRAHANENKIILDRFTQHTVDPLALMSNVSYQQYYSQSSTTPPSTYVPPHFADNTQLDSGLSPMDNLIENLTNTLALLTQSYKTYLPQTNNQLIWSSNTRNQATVQVGRVVVQNVQGRQNRGQGTMHRVQVQLVMGELRTELGMQIQVKQGRLSATNATENGVALDEEQLLFIAGGQDNAVDEDVNEQPVQDLALNVDNVFQADECDAFDSDVDGAPTAHTMFMTNLSSVDPVCDEAGLSYDSDILSEVNAESVVQSHVSSVPNDAYMMIINEMYEPSVQSVSANKQNKVVNASLTAELATYKEQVELYERRAKFELTEREQKIEEQLRIVIADRNIKEENLKKELHSVKMQLSSTINHNKSMVDEVTSLKKYFKQKENKYLEEFLDMKALKEKVEDKLYKQDQSLQTVHMLCKPKPYYDEQKKVAIGNKNPLLHNSEETLEIAEITRKKMNEKMKDPECVKKKVKIAPHDYSKENYLATFTPEKQLTPEQIFWSNDLIKMKTEALKEQTTASRPIKALTVYPPNTPATLVPRVLPTKSQVKINIFALIQLFLEFEKTCKKRITPTGLTEEERGFEQTKACYLTEVIPFFKTLKEHFEGIHKALTKEVKEMKEIFEELEAEVDQNAVHRKHDEIEGKNLLIANDNLIADCLSKDVFYIATNSELTVSRFTEMHDAHTVVQARCLELEAELSKLHDKVQKDDHAELVKRFSNLEVNHLNLHLKYQNLKESFGNNTSSPARDAPDFDSVFVIEKMKASIQGKDNAIKKLRMQISQLNETRSEADRTLDFRALDFQITQLTKKVTVLQEQNELFRAENEKVKQHYKELYAIDVEPIPPRNRSNREVHLDYLKHLKESVETLCEIVEEATVERPLDSSLASACLYTKHSQELLEYVIGTCPKDFNTRDKQHASTPLTRKKQVTFEDQCETSNSNTHKHVEQLNIQKTNVHVPPFTGVNSCTDASGSQPRSNTKKNRILPAKSVNKKKVEERPRTNKSSLKTTNRVDSSISSKRTHSVNASPSVKNVMRKVKQVWKPTGKILTNVGYQWMPTGRTFTLGEQCPLTRLTKSKVVPANQMENISRTNLPLVFGFRLLKTYDGGSFMAQEFREKFIGTVRFGNDHFGAIMGYGDYVIGDSVISRVYYVEGLGHNLFSVRQFCDSDLEVAFRKHSCYVRDTDGVELIKGSRGSNLYTISVEDMMKSSPICLLSKASKNKSWLWHRRLNHLNFGTINDLARKDLVRGLPRLKFEKDHLCSACQLGKSKKHTHTPKTKNTNLEVLNTLHMDLFPKTPQQNGVVKRWNRTLVEAARTMLIFSKALMFLWAEAVATAYYTQNRSLIHTRHNKTPYELVHDKKPDLTFFEYLVLFVTLLMTARIL